MRRPAQYLQQAVDAYRSALQVWTREQLPQDWAVTQNNLGAALQDLAGAAKARRPPNICNKLPKPTVAPFR